MLTRKTIFTLATLATLGTAALAPSSASAWGFHGGGHFGGHWGGGHWGGGHWGGWGHRWAGGGWGHRWGGWRGYGYYRPVCGGWRSWERHFCHGPSYPVSYGGGYAAPTAAYAAAPSGPAPASSGCPTKGYTPDGSVVFTDRCTQEGAVGPATGDNGPPQGGPGGPRGPAGPGR